MPNCIQFVPKSNPNADAVPLARIDEEMCKHFKASVQPTQYYFYWFDTIGFSLAMGKTYDQIREQFKADRASDTSGPAYWDKMLAIVDWLEANYVPNAWAEIGKGR